MSVIRSTLILIAAIIVSSVSGWAADAQATCPAPNAGFEILKFGSMNLGVWYPTNAPESPYSYNDNISGTVALNGAISTCAKYPLVVFSHGYGGCGTQSVFLTEQLARYGYIIAAPDHADAGCSVTSTTGNPTISITGGSPPFGNPAIWNNQSYYNRYVDNENTINGMLSQAMFGPQIDPTKIAMSGHSLGGYDTFAMIGGWSNWLDPRVKVGLMLSPFIQPFLDQVPSTVPNAAVPQMYQGGTLDIGITPYIMASGGQYDQAQTPKIFLELQGAGHLDFSNKVCGSNPTTVQTCLATVPNAAYIDNYSVAFLNFYLNNIQTTSLLWGQGAGLANFWRNTPAAAVSSASYRPGGQLTANEISSLFGQGMANTTVGASGNTLPTNLGGTVVTVTDSLKVSRQAQLFFASPQQVNFVVPPGSSAGTAQITVTQNGSIAASASTVVASGLMTIAATSPSIFTVNSSGAGLVNGLVQNGLSFSLTFNPGTLAPVPIDVSTGTAYLTVAATGAPLGSASVATALVGTTPVPVLAVYSYAPFTGLEGIILGPFPASLQGSGTQTIALSIGGVPANPVTIQIQ